MVPPAAAARGPPGSGVGRQGMSICCATTASYSTTGLVRRWQQWQRVRRQGAAAPACRDRRAALLAATATAPTARGPPALHEGGARLTAAIKATRDPQQLLELLRRADPQVAAAADAAADVDGAGAAPSRQQSSSPYCSSSPLNALHAAAALTHCAQLVVEAEAEAAQGMWRRGRRPSGGGGGGGSGDDDGIISGSNRRASAASAAAAPALLALAALHAPRFSPRQCANVMWAVSRLGWLQEGVEGGGVGGPSNGNQRARAARCLLATLAARLDGGRSSSSSDSNSPAPPPSSFCSSYWPQLQPQELVMALEAAAAAAAAGAPAPADLAWLRGCLSALRRAAPTLGPREHCSVAAALARLLQLGGRGDAAARAARASFAPLILEPALRGAWMYAPRDVASLLQALSLAASSGFRPPAAWVAAFLRAATDSADARRAAEVCGGFDQGEELQVQEDDEDGANAANDARAAAAALLALARLGFAPPRAWLAPRLRALGSAPALRALGTGGLALLGYAVARSGARPPAAWTRAWLGAALASWRRVGGGGEGEDDGDGDDDDSDHNGALVRRPPTAQEAAMTAWALAKLRARPPEAWMAALAAGAGRAVARERQGDRGGAFGAADAERGGGACVVVVASSTLLWAFGRIGYRPASAVLRVLYRALLAPPSSSSSFSSSARCLAAGLGAAARLQSPPPPSFSSSSSSSSSPRPRAAPLLLPSGALAAWLRAAAASGMCDVWATDAETRRARAVGAWALATLRGGLLAPAPWRRAFFTAAAAGVLLLRRREPLYWMPRAGDYGQGGAVGRWGEEQEEQEEDEGENDDRLQDAAALAWAAARSLGRGSRRRRRQQRDEDENQEQEQERGGEEEEAGSSPAAGAAAAEEEEAAAAAAAAAAVVLAALREARRALAPADRRRAGRLAVRRRASAAVLCIWSGAKLAQRQAMSAGAFLAAADGGEAAAAARAAAATVAAARLRRATASTMRALAADADGCARLLRTGPAAASAVAPRDLARAAHATALLQSSTLAGGSRGPSPPPRPPPPPLPPPPEWLALMYGATAPWLARAAAAAPDAPAQLSDRHLAAIAGGLATQRGCTPPPWAWASAAAAAARRRGGGAAVVVVGRRAR